ncbi:hypothetical protein FNH22_28150 [Fulvivirga sp. M361]|uniref:PA14 domain-containing protein n=1 Tax=Fulvivirga sp. M361 TaxID=2594266 RepID=UPI001179A9A4|nr:PA14 domain-containing protein [Fulvivirga sp. M361]TRX48911.1 hypothetical protein FNH22_28150 [Fulvivirga sp. M361]
MKKSNVPFDTSLRILLCICLLFINLHLVGQDMPGESFTIKSEYMGSEREVQVALPDGYNTWTNYDVQYMLDPVWNMKQRKSLLEFLRNNGMTPRTILVGIVSPDRNSDMLPIKSEGTPTGGNADKFIDFIGREVKPFIEEKYKTSGYNTFAGHSFGGFCVMYAFLKHPEYFDAYLVSDPSFWYGDELLVQMAKEKLPAIESGKVLFIGGREGNAYKSMGIASMEKVLEEHAPDDLDWKTVAYEDETHNSVTYKLNYDGIKFISQDFRNSAIEFIPHSGEVVPGEPVSVFLQSDTKLMKYTLDGSEPGFESEVFRDSLTLSEPATLKIKIPLKRSKLRPAFEGEFSKGEKLKGLKKKRNYAPGLNYTYYEGDWNKLPDFDTLKMIKQGAMIDRIDLNSLPKKEKFGCVFEGFFEAKESGYHYFSISSDDGIKFYIHDKLMINHDWRHSTYKSKSTVLYLEQGLHPVRFEYFQHQGGAEINLFSKLPKERPQPLDYNRFWRKSVK